MKVLVEILSTLMLLPVLLVLSSKSKLPLPLLLSLIQES